MKKSIFYLFIFLGFYSCKNDKAAEELIPAVLTPETEVKGYKIFNHINGIWSGDVISDTPLGNFNDWVMDIRPVSASQVSGKSELDSLNDIFFSFFLVKYNNEFRIALRNGGGFAGMQRVSYLLCDSVYEDVSIAYFRFSDFKAGTARCYAEYSFFNDSMDVKVYTNKYNSVAPAELHMHWMAKLQDSTDAQDALTYFGFPKKELVKDFSTTFSSMTESIFYSIANDPYPVSEQPYLGQSTVNISYSGSLTITPGTKSFIIITTQPLFSGFSYLPANEKFRSRYVILDVNDNNYSFVIMHPDSYYVYVINDNNSDLVINSGDYINHPLTPIQYTLAESGQSIVNVNVNFVIP